MATTYLVFHFNRLTDFKVSCLNPWSFLFEWLDEKGMTYLYKEFSVAAWDKDSDSRGGIKILLSFDSKGGVINE